MLKKDRGSASRQAQDWKTGRGGLDFKPPQKKRFAQEILREGPQGEGDPMVGHGRVQWPACSRIRTRVLGLPEHGREKRDSFPGNTIVPNGGFQVVPGKPDQAIPLFDVC